MGFLIFIDGFAVICLVLAIIGIFVNGLEFIITLIVDHFFAIFIFLEILDIFYYLGIATEREKNNETIAKIIGFPIVLGSGILPSIISLLSCHCILKWYLNNTFGTGIISTFAMLTIGLVFVLLALVPLGAKALAWNVLLLYDDKIPSFWINIFIYVFLNIFCILLSTALTYFLGCDTNVMLQDFQNKYLVDIYQFFVNINPINPLIDMF